MRELFIQWKQRMERTPYLMWPLGINQSEVAESIAMQGLPLERFSMNKQTTLLHEEGFDS